MKEHKITFNKCLWFLSSVLMILFLPIIIFIVLYFIDGKLDSYKLSNAMLITSFLYLPGLCFFISYLYRNYGQTISYDKQKIIIHLKGKNSTIILKEDIIKIEKIKAINLKYGIFWGRYEYIRIYTTHRKKEYYITALILEVDNLTATLKIKPKEGISFFPIAI